MKSLDNWTSESIDTAGVHYLELRDELEVANEIEFIFSLDFVSEALGTRDYYEN